MKTAEQETSSSKGSEVNENPNQDARGNDVGLNREDEQKQRLQHGAHRMNEREVEQQMAKDKPRRRGSV
jgi:hypothetical protein